MNKIDENYVYQLLLTEQCAAALQFFELRYKQAKQKTAEKSREYNAKWLANNRAVKNEAERLRYRNKVSKTE